MTSKNPHPHAALIAEWVQDTNKEIEMCEEEDRGYPNWEKTLISSVTNDKAGRLKFRFKPSIVSSLTDEELYEIAASTNSHEDDINLPVLRAVANASNQQAIEELHVPEGWLVRTSLSPRHLAFLKQAITDYLTALKEGKLNDKPEGSRLPACY